MYTGREAWKVYSYEGPVKMFGDTVTEFMQAYTRAASAGQARSNIAYRWKRDRGYSADTKITLPGEIKEVV